MVTVPPPAWGNPPSFEALSAGMVAWIAERDNVRPDDSDNAQRAAARVRAARKAACGAVYEFVRARWPSPVDGRNVVSAFLPSQRDPERRLREVRDALTAMGHAWAIDNRDGTWALVRREDW